jgi:hypothetical protein
MARAVTAAGLVGIVYGTQAAPHPRPAGPVPVPAHATARVGAPRGDFHVAPGGDDGGAGTLEKPFRTVARARDAVRELRRRGRVRRPITVLIRGGTYPLSESMIFSGRDSGTAASPVIYRAFPGEHPVFTGGRIVTGWKVYRDRIMSAALPRTENQYWRFRELFFNGKRQVRARWPDYRPEDPLYGGWGFVEAAVPADSAAPAGFRYEGGTLPRRWAKPELGEVFIIPGLAWNSNIVSIRDVDQDARVIRLKRGFSAGWDKLMPGNRFYAENLLEELDQPGEWCFDSETQMLYFWPPTGSLTDGEVSVPVIDRLIELRPTSGAPVRHLRFAGLTFTQTLPVFPNFHPLHPDYVDCNRPNSGGYAVYLENAEYCAIEDCTFDQVGGDAIRLHNHNAYNRITGNEIAGAGAQGICLAYLDLWPYDFPPVWRGQEQRLRSLSDRLPWAVGNVISGNHIHHSGVIDNFGAAIHLHGLNCQDNVISHNVVHDMPHHAIYLSMGFGRNVIEYNDLYTLCQVMADAGGIYSNRWSIIEDDAVLRNGTVIRYNRIRDVIGVHPFAKPPAQATGNRGNGRIETPYFTWGIYFDNSPRRASVYSNITSGNVWGGAFLGGGYAEPQDCVIENNVFIESSVYQFDLSMSAKAAGNRFVRNIVYFKNPKAALLRAGAPNGIRECDYNTYFHPGAGPLRLPGVPGESLEKWRELGFDSHSVIADPLFVDPEKGDFRLKPDSPALKVGFKPIPVERIGLKRGAR